MCCSGVNVGTTFFFTLYVNGLPECQMYEDGANIYISAKTTNTNLSSFCIIRPYIPSKIMYVLYVVDFFIISNIVSLESSSSFYYYYISI